jgi:transcription initiation factor TFIIIB Brf1 subunit/transcription initiation factor TFIIB
MNPNKSEEKKNHRNKRMRTPITNQIHKQQLSIVQYEVNLAKQLNLNTNNNNQSRNMQKVQTVT